MPSQQESPSSEAQPTLRVRLVTRGGELARQGAAWMGEHRLLAGGTTLMMIGLAVGLLWLFRAAIRQHDVTTVQMAWKALDEGAFTEARTYALRLRDPGMLPYDELGAPSFILGVVAMHDAEDSLGKSRQDHYKLAARYLEHARSLGFAPDRASQGMLLLGRALFHSGQQQASRQVLDAALQSNPEHATELHLLLAQAYLAGPQPDRPAALEQVSKYLQDETLTSRARWEAQLLEGQILFQLGRYEDCGQVLAPLVDEPNVRAEATILQARLEMHAAERLLQDAQSTDEPDVQQSIRQRYQAAIDALRTAQGHDTLENATTAKSMYLIGRCQLALGDGRAALEQFDRTSKLYFDTPEGFVATLDEADLLLDTGRDAEAAEAYRLALERVPAPAEFQNPWISLDSVRQRMLAAYERLLANEKFELLAPIADQLYPLLSRSRSVELKAQAERQWARALFARADQLPLSTAVDVRRDGREHARRAGQEFVRLARLRLVTREYPDQLYQAAECFLEGHDYRNAIRFFELYLDHESRRRRPQVLVGLGEAYLALDRIDDALGACDECIQFFALDAASFQARLIASQARLELGESDVAEQLLLDNLQGDYLTPASREWRDSLLALGSLLHLQQRYPEAVERLEEAVARYPQDRRSWEFRYLLADSYSQLATSLRDKAREANVASARAAMLKQAQDVLRKAVEQYEVVQLEMTQQQSHAALTELQHATLRNCYFARGAALGDLEQYEEAIEAFSIASSRYQASPVVLEAYVETADLYRRMNQDDEAVGILQQAKVILNRLQTNEPFTETTNYSREQWAVYLDWLLKL